jgi:hypothetical protein
MHILKIVLNVIAVAIWLFIFSYILHLEKIGCECSKTWQRSFIKYFVIVIIVMLGLTTFEIWSPKTTHPSLLTLYFVATIAFVLITYHYIQMLKVQKCACSQHLARDVLEIVNYIQLFLIALTFILMIYFMFSFSQILPQAKTIKKSLKK